MSEEKVIAPSQPKLWDLYVEGREVEFDVNGSEKISVWVQKLTPAETQEAVRRARPVK